MQHCGRERTMKMTFPGGQVHYEGEHGNERLVKATYEDSQVYHFEGEQDNERLVKVTYADGQAKLFEGERGNERLVKITYADGQVKLFEGEKGQERNVIVIQSDGTLYYVGEKDDKRILSKFRLARGGALQYENGGNERINVDDTDNNKNQRQERADTIAAELCAAEEEAEYCIESTKSRKTRKKKAKGHRKVAVLESSSTQPDVSAAQEFLDKQPNGIEVGSVEESHEKCCAVCWEGGCELVAQLYTLVPCGHECVCAKCALPLKKCPLCRVPIEWRGQMRQFKL